LARVPRSLSAQQRRAVSRGVHDLVTTPSGRPIISSGQPGRSAITGHVATVFGCTGFLGRYLVAKLAKAGTQVIVPYRDQEEQRHLRVTGDLGQVVPMEWDLRSDEQIEECIRHSDIVYNLVGRDHETKNFKYDAVHVEGAARIASIAAQNSKTSRFIHVSHLNASHDSPSEFYKTKAEGEERVLEAFPGAIIVRPASFFGHEDKLLNSMSAWPLLWKFNDAETLIRPVHVQDVAQALANFLTLPPPPKQILNLPGPQQFSYAELMELISLFTFHPPSKLPAVPKSIALLISRVSQAIWWPTLSPDEIKRRFIDDSQVHGDWDLVGVQPEEVQALALGFLRRYRSAANFVRPVVLPGQAGRSNSSYHLGD